MSLVTRLRSRLSRGDESVIGAGAIRIGGEQYDARWTATRVLESVYKNPTGKRCIERNASAFQRPNWAIVSPNAKDKPLENHKLLDVLNKPAPHMTGTRMQYHLRRDLDMAGGSFWLKLYGQDYLGDKGAVTGLRRLSPLRTSVLTNDDDELVGFIHTDKAGRNSPIFPEELIFVNLPDGEGEWTRNPPGLAAGLPSDISNNSMRFNAELIKNDGGLPGYLVVEGLETKQFKEWVSAWKSAEEPGKTRFMSSKGQGKHGATYVRVGQSNQEMMYDRLKAMADDDIARSLGYPSVLLNPDGTTFANMDVANRTWYMGEVFPMWVWVWDTFSIALEDQLGGNLIRFDLSQIEEMSENLDSIVERGVRLLDSGAWTINEFREKLGQPPVAWGNTPLRQTQDASLTQNATDANPVERIELKPPKDEPKKALPVATTKATKPYLGKFHQIVERQEIESTGEIAKFFNAQGKAIAARIRGKKGKAYTKAVSDWWDGERWNTSLAQVVHTELSKTAKPIGDLAMSTFVPGASYDMTSVRQVEYLRSRSTEIAGLINTTTEEALRELIGELAAQETSIDEIAAAITDYFVDYSTTRAMRVARTELIGAANFSALEAARESGVVTGKHWNAASTADGECLALDAEGTIPLDAEFDGGFSHPPAHVNCRCALDFEVD